LQGNLTIEDLQTNNYQAYARNKLIAEAFYLTGDIEKYGSGFRRIRNELKQYPTMKLDCKEIPNGFLATVSYTERKTSLNVRSDNVTDGATNVTDVTNNVTDVTNNVSDNVTDNVTNKVIPNITKGEQRILTVIRSNNEITQDKIGEALNISTNTVKKFISKLKNKGVLARKNGYKSGYWEIFNN
jgi:ATP-dependent DNA helicase RecG